MKSPITNQPGLPVWRMRTAWLALIPALVILCVAAANRPDSDEDRRDQSGSEIEGTWRVELLAPPNFPAPPDWPPPPWQGTKTFIRGGIMLEKNELPGNKPGFGVWKQKGPHEFTFTFEFFWEDPSATDPVKRFLMTKVRETVRLTARDKYESVESVGQDYDHAGNLLACYELTSRGHRMHVESVTKCP